LGPDDLIVGNNRRCFSTSSYGWNDVDSLCWLSSVASRICYWQDWWNVSGFGCTGSASSYQDDLIVCDNRRCFSTSSYCWNDVDSLGWLSLVASRSCYWQNWRNVSGFGCTGSASSYQEDLVVGNNWCFSTSSYYDVDSLGWLLLVASRSCYRQDWWNVAGFRCTVSASSCVDVQDDLIVGNHRRCLSTNRYFLGCC
jgi:hypothetical protein